MDGQIRFGRLRYLWEIERQGRVPGHASFAYHNLSIKHRPYDQAALGPEVAPGPYPAARFLEVAEDGAEELRQALGLIEASARADAVPPRPEVRGGTARNR
ncbi:hypothetical protein ACFSL4_03275 [Streptomyces caeni]|uniref:Uncharacterized protein n=1 Tax=Streptomyces caeni TaxID=2307231 RepID=A0ABW4IKS1_9ACTN